VRGDQKVWNYPCFPYHIHIEFTWEKEVSEQKEYFLLYDCQPLERGMLLNVDTEPKQGLLR
jgi:hypothetical protein